MHWFQKNLVVEAKPRGFHLITAEIMNQLPQISELKTGLFNLFILHTSASLTINENADPDVRRDMEVALNHMVPESLDFVHTAEGPDDMPAHVKSSLMGSSLTIPIANGKLALGTWQGIYLCEHRDRASERHLIATFSGSD